MPIRARAGAWTRETIRRIDSAVLDDFKPDLTLILDLDVETGLDARHARGGGAENRFEKFDRDFHERLRQAFLDIARRNPDRCLVIDAVAAPRTRWRRRFGRP